jgi:hypothetical protein
LLRSEKNSMWYSPGLAYGVAFLAAVVLTAMAVQNRRSGWRRLRHDDILDAWKASALARHGQMVDAVGVETVSPPRRVVMDAVAATRELIALQAGIGTGVNLHNKDVGTPDDVNASSRETARPPAASRS